MSLDLSSSLTAMEWLPQLRVGGQQQPVNIASGLIRAAPVGTIPVTDGTNIYHVDPRRVPPPRPIGRKLPPSPIDLSARLDPLEAQAYRYHDAKPPYSYATLITYAINSSPKRRMTLNEIYTWICNNFPYYREAGTGWKVIHSCIHYSFGQPIKKMYHIFEVLISIGIL